MSSPMMMLSSRCRDRTSIFGLLPPPPSVEDHPWSSAKGLGGLRDNGVAGGDDDEAVESGSGRWQGDAMTPEKPETNRRLADDALLGRRRGDAWG